MMQYNHYAKYFDSKSKHEIRQRQMCLLRKISVIRTNEKTNLERCTKRYFKIVNGVLLSEWSIKKKVFFRGL